MKRITKYLIALLVLSLIVSIVPAAFAAEYEAAPGQTVGVVFELKNIKSINGEITVNDPDGIVDSAKVMRVETELSGSNANNILFYSSFIDQPANFKLVYSVTLKKSAPEGATCSVVISYEVTEANNAFNAYTFEKSIVVEKPEETQPTQPTEPSTQPTEPKPTEPKPTEPKPTEPKPTEPKPTEPKPTTPSVTVDTAKLKELVNTAVELDASLYSAESWAKLQDALKKGQDALKSKDQSVIDAAAAALEKAINELVALDRSALEAAIVKVEKFLNEDSIASKVKELIGALENAKEVLNGQDQAAMDEAAALLEQLLDELQKAIIDLSKVEEIIKEIEKIVEVAPKDPYCNISMHYVWPILFFISLALNAGFIILIIVYFVRKKKNQTDDTPLVDYDIADDVDQNSAE